MVLTKCDYQVEPVQVVSFLDNVQLHTCSYTYYNTLSFFLLLFQSH